MTALLAEAYAQPPTLKRVGTGDFDEAQNERIRAAVRTYMADHKLTAKAFAAKLRISDASLSNIRSGKNGMGSATARAFAALLKVPVDDLVGPSGDPPQPIVVKEDRYHAMPAVRVAAKIDGEDEYLEDFDPPFKASYQPSPEELLATWRRHVAKKKGKAAAGDTEAPSDL